MHLDEFLQQSVAILAAAVVVVFLSARLRVPAVIGLIATGMLIGPSGFALVKEAAQVEVFAEIGVVLLLFIIGLELSLAALRELGRPFLLGGGLQAALTIAGAAALAFAWTPAPREALFAAWVVTLSSTAVVLKLYDQRRETQTPQGRVVLGILLFQDFLIVPMIVLTPVLAGNAAASPGKLLLRFGSTLVALGLLVLAARFVIPRLLYQLVRVRVRELFVMTGLVFCLAMSWLTYSLGFSLALGAFLAGLLISETEYKHQVFADVVPFRDVFSSLFFISIGMLVDLSFAASHLGALLALTTAFIVLKAVAAGAAIRLVGYPLRISVVGGLGLAQLGEFGFVLMAVGRANGLLDESGYQTLLAAAVLTLLVAPFLVRAAPLLGELIVTWIGVRAAAPAPAEKELGGHVIVVGYGMNGSLLCRVLGEARIPYLVLELSADTVRRASAKGVRIHYGDASRREILEHAGIARAQVVVFAISDWEAVRRSVRLARDLNPSVEIIVRTRMVKEIEELRLAGAQEVVAEEFEAAIEIFTLVLERYHVPRNVIRAQTRVLRGEGYRMLRSPQMRASPEVLAALEQGTTDLYRIGEESRAAGRTLAELDLRRVTGASVIAVVRGERSFVNPSPELELELGDCLVLVGGHPEIDQAFQFLDRPAPDPA